MFHRRSLFIQTRNLLAGLAVPAIIHGGRRSTLANQPSADTSDDAFATMPFDHPPFGAPPLTFGKRSGVTLVVKTRADLVRTLLPKPLEPVGSEIIIQQHQNAILVPMKVDYPNATVIVPANLKGTDGFYMSRVYEGSAQATMLSIWGREIWGFPKVAADTNVSRKGTEVTSYVRALNGAAKVDVHVELDTRQQPIVEPPATIALYCRKTIPSADGDGLDLDRLIEAPWRSTAEHRIPATVTKCEIKLDLGGKSVPLPIEEHVDAFWFTQDDGSILDKGRVVHDYLS